MEPQNQQPANSAPLNAKYKHCPDCGQAMKHRRSDCGWAEYYDCPQCELNINIMHGETMHYGGPAGGDTEIWTRNGKRTPAI